MIMDQEITVKDLRDLNPLTGDQPETSHQSKTKETVDHAGLSQLLRLLDQDSQFSSKTLPLNGLNNKLSTVFLHHTDAMDVKVDGHTKLCNGSSKTDLYHSMTIHTLEFKEIANNLRLKNLLHKL